MESNQPIVHVSITDMVADKLRDGIRDGTFRVSQKLIETELCKTMEVSRTPIRKAFHVLLEEGLLERIEGYGIVVTGGERKRSYWLEILGALERIALERAVIHSSNTDLAELEKVQLNLEEIWEGTNGNIDPNSPEWKAVSTLDMEFHNRIVRASTNPFLGEFIDMAARKGNITYYHGKIIEADISEHRIMIKAIEDKNTELADKIMKQHFR